MEEKIDVENIKETDLYLLKAIQDAIKALNIIEELIETNGPRQSETDSILSDYEHILEEGKTRNRKISDEGYIRIAKKIEIHREIRRHQKNEFELERIYMQQKDKLFHKEYRAFFANEIYRRFTELNQPYKPRVLTEEEIEMLLENSVDDKPKARARKRSNESEEINQKIMQMLEEGYSQSKIATELGMSQPSVSIRVKKIKGLQNA